MEDKRKAVLQYINKHCDDIKLSTNLEESAYADIKENMLLNKNFIYQYVYNVQFIVSNIDKIKEKTINPKDLFTKSSIELFPKYWKESEKRYYEAEKFIYGKKKVANTTTVTCFKCKQNIIFFYTRQLRSADEPETCFYECLECGNKWRR